MWRVTDRAKACSRDQYDSRVAQPKTTAYFSCEHLKFRYEPFHIGLANPLMDQSTYQELVASYPAIKHFHNIPKSRYLKIL